METDSRHSGRRHHVRVGWNGGPSNPTAPRCDWFKNEASPHAYSISGGPMSEYYGITTT